MLLQLNLAALAVAGQLAWKRIKPAIIKEAILLPLTGFLEVISFGGLWQLF